MGGERNELKGQCDRGIVSFGGGIGQRDSKAHDPEKKYLYHLIRLGQKRGQEVNVGW